MHRNSEPSEGKTSFDPVEAPTAAASRLKNISYAVLAAQGGCFSLLIIFVALFVGLWLDAQTGRHGPFTIGLLLLSIPLSLFVMVRLALGTISQIKVSPGSARQQKTRIEEDDR